MKRTVSDSFDFHLQFRAKFAANDLPLLVPNLAHCCRRS